MGVPFPSPVKSMQGEGNGRYREKYFKTIPAKAMLKGLVEAFQPATPPPPGSPGEVDPDPGEQSELTKLLQRALGVLADELPKVFILVMPNGCITNPEGCQPNP